jgi:hypothetical protein
MTKERKKRLSLDRPTTYEIKVPGVIDESQADWAGTMEITVGSDGDNPPVTTLTGEFDQAALHGLLRRLYSMGLPLVSVIWIERSANGIDKPN